MGAALAVGGFLLENAATIATVASTAYSAYAQSQQKAPEMPKMPEMPDISVPKNKKTYGMAQKGIEKRRTGRSSTIKTSPLGLGRANIGKKSLLGT